MRTQKFSFKRSLFYGNLFPEYVPVKWYVYLLTDANRGQFRTGICSDLPEFLHLLAQASRLAPSGGLKSPDKLVYLERNIPVRKAEKRLTEIIALTRMQKDRLIRSYNPDWKDLKALLLAESSGDDKHMSFSDAKLSGCFKIFKPDFA